MAALTVFVIDDEPIIANTVSTILRSAGFQVFTFYDGAAMIAAHRTAPDPDVVVTDYSMPNVDGLTLTAWLEEHHPRCRIIMITGQAALLAGRTDRGRHFTVLEKPVPPLKLIATVAATQAA